jgi:hypothetical protein
MSFDKPVKDVGGTEKFRKFFDSLNESDSFKKEIREARDLLKENLGKGNKIEHKKWPDEYRQMKLTNLWRFKLHSGGRMVYTILSDSDGFLVSIIEAFRTHNEYTKKFDYD